MNRLVLIGNGYDLAAGLKTSYEDFLVDYFKTVLKTINEPDANYKDEIIELQYIGDKLNLEIYLPKIDSIRTIEDLKKCHILEINNGKKERFTGESLKIKTGIVEVTIKSTFLQKILFKQNWRDIESFYFKELLERYNDESYPSMEFNFMPKNDQEIEKPIVKLNREFGDLKSKLVDYLKGIADEISNEFVAEPLTSLRRVTEKLDSEIFNRFFNNDSKSKTDIELKRVYIVNFNYTPTLGMHSIMQNNKTIPFYIHGVFDKPEDIIFGYGDDSHPAYEKLEACGDDEYLKHIKSFHYPHSKSYIDLMNYIEADQFEVQIIGHSLGLSDRVLLKSIFENENCKLIKIYHRGNKNDMIHKYMALSRHCSDKAAMRRKILEYDDKDVVNSIE